MTDSGNEVSKEWVYELYWGEGMSMAKIADQTNVTGHTIGSRMDDWGIQKRPGSRRGGIKQYVATMRFKNKLWLVDKYWFENRSTREIADLAGVDKTLIRKWMGDLDIPKRDKMENSSFGDGGKQNFAGLSWNGYHRIWSSWSDGKTNTVSVHRLAAVSEYGFDSVKDKVVHHTNEIPWLNVPKFDMDIPELEKENLVTISPVKHGKAHNKKSVGGGTS